ncbi:Acetyltransferase (GNAT) family protein [Halogranum amylolyticum]|uniref:Acetyltransferase (GNAT) family protein n=1 Tax=Halogranum amylolyticum TaxID=660520 RepID=A0A1H8S0U1_9EURY|nr:GNAT family N-acetyltransferase [Halogranum amylolyticum]SEO72157.1 Acetyltransferase (GNAT) family protein [Halogranum amylolyticum]
MSDITTEEPPIAIESPTVSEVETLADLWVDLARGQREYGSHLRTASNREFVRDTIAHQIASGGILVARATANELSEIVGFVTFSPESGQYDQDVTRGVIQNLYVVPERRDEGVGEKLLAAAESRFATAGIDVVTLDAMAANEAARRFYRRQGYRVHRVELEKRVENDNKTRQDD